MKRKIVLNLICFLFLSVVLNSRVHAQEKDYRAYSIYVYNFIKYIEWPESSKEGEFVIAVIGDSPITKELRALAASKKANGQTILVRNIVSLTEIGNAQILYISTGKSSLIKDVLEKTKNVPTLVIAEREGLVKKGAGINFLTLDDETLKFELNKKAIEGHNLRISQTLISLAFVEK
ncbi:MAG: hypothetical protein K0Q95_1518 [Bacteroidota bacterium]|jgi:hypothetical protein|nr:hypothetical protein [Bacteroidota bacterium]